MWLYLLNMLIVNSVQSLTIGYPYSALLAFNPVRSQLSDKPAGSQGFLVYLDNSGIERIAGYNYAEPVYALHQINYINSGATLVQHLVQEDFSEATKAREAHFRAWSLQQYQVLKREIDSIRGEGKEPSAEMMLKFLPLEKIALTSDYTIIAELPEVKQIREEHLNIWKQISQSDEDHIKLAPLNIEATPAQKLAHIKTEILKSENKDKSDVDQLNSTKASDNLKNVQPKARFIKFSEKVLGQKVQTAEEVNKKFDEKNSKSNISLPQQVVNTLEVSKTHEKHLNSVNYVKQKIPDQRKMQSALVSKAFKSDQYQRNLSTIVEPIKQLDEKNLKVGNDQTFLQLPQQVFDTRTPEVVRVREEHLNLVNEVRQQINAHKKIQSDAENPIPSISAIEKDDLKVTMESEQKLESSEVSNENEYKENFKKTIVQPHALGTPEVAKVREEQKICAQKKVQSEVEKFIFTAPKIYVPQQVVDTAEVMRVRNEHLRIVNEAIQKAKLAQAQQPVEQVENA